MRKIDHIPVNGGDVVFQEHLKPRTSKTLKQSPLSNVAFVSTRATHRLLWLSPSATQMSLTRFDFLFAILDLTTLLTGSGLWGACRMVEAPTRVHQPCPKCHRELQLSLIFHVKGEYGHFVRMRIAKYQRSSTRRRPVHT